jgi:hypothetical protein
MQAELLYPSVEIAGLKFSARNVLAGDNACGVEMALTVARAATIDDLGVVTLAAHGYENGAKVLVAWEAGSCFATVSDVGDDSFTAADPKGDALPGESVDVTVSLAYIFDPLGSSAGFEVRCQLLPARTITRLLFAADRRVVLAVFDEFGATNFFVDLAAGTVVDLADVTGGPQAFLANADTAWASAKIAALYDAT